MNTISVHCEESLKGTHTLFLTVEIGYNSPLPHQLTQAKILPAHKEKKDFFVQNCKATRKKCQTYKITYHCTQMFQLPVAQRRKSQFLENIFYFQFSCHFLLTFVREEKDSRYKRVLQPMNKKVNCCSENINLYNASIISY